MSEKLGKTIKFEEPDLNPSSGRYSTIDYSFSVVDEKYEGTIKEIKQTENYLISATITQPTIASLSGYIKNKIVVDETQLSSEQIELIIEKYLFHRIQSHISDMLDSNEIKTDPVVIDLQPNSPELDELEEIILAHEKLRDPNNPDERIVRWIPDEE